MPEEKTQTENQPTAAPEPRFSKAALDFIDALLLVQRQRFESELSANSAHAQSLYELTSPPPSMDVLAESDAFLGTGWSDIGKRRDGIAFRWMGRLGTLMCPVDLTEGATVRVEGTGFSKRRHLKELTFWLEDQPIEGRISRRGFNRWIFEGSVEALPPRPYSILRIQSAGQSRLAVGVDKYVSVAVSRVVISGGTAR